LRRHQNFSIKAWPISDGRPGSTVTRRLCTARSFVLALRLSHAAPALPDGSRDAIAQGAGPTEILQISNLRTPFMLAYPPQPCTACRYARLSISRRLVRPERVPVGKTPLTGRPPGARVLVLHHDVRLRDVGPCGRPWGQQKCR
jgi:hypothetical protein